MSPYSSTAAWWSRIHLSTACFNSSLSCGLKHQAVDVEVLVELLGVGVVLVVLVLVLVELLGA